MWIVRRGCSRWMQSSEKICAPFDGAITVRNISSIPVVAAA